MEEYSKNLEAVDSPPSRTQKDRETINLKDEALNYLCSHEWCEEIEKGWLAESWGYILGVFLFKIKSNIPEVDDYVWVIVGDIPPAYIDIESASNSKEVIMCYIDIMSDWVNHVKEGKPVDECYPVEVPETKEYALMLESRLSLISEELKNEA